MLQFLAWFNGDWLTTIGSEIMGAMEVGIRTLSFSLATIIYQVIIFLYDMFEMLCRGRLLDNELLSELSARVGLILGIIMFLSVVFSMVKILLDPDKFNDKEMGVGAILKKIIIVIIMLGLSNFVFSTLYKVQQVVVESHIISNLILPYKISDDDLNNFGNVLAEELLSAFYQLENLDTTYADNESKEMVEACKGEINAFKSQIVSSGKFDLGYNCLNESVKIVEGGTSVGLVEKDKFVVSYNWLFCIAAGAMTAYLLFMYCFKIGVRMVQLMFLEIISPMAIVGYLSPKKDNMFNKWSKIYVATYIDVFIRVIIINFVIFLIATIFSETGGDGHFIFWESIGGKPDDIASTSFITVVIVLALLTFAKKAPDLLKELFPASASKLGFGTSMKDIVGLQKGINMTAGLGATAAVGLIGGAANGKGLGRLTGAIGGAIGGAFRGAKAGYGAKGIGSAMSQGTANQAKASLKKQQMILSGATFGDRLGTAFNSKFGVLDSYEKLNAENSSYSDLKTTVEDEQIVKNAQNAYDKALESWVEAGNTADTFDATATGSMYKNAIDQAKRDAYSELMLKDKAFQVKVDMHNRRFGTRYGASTNWDVINAERKEVKAATEAQQARKPKS